MPTGDFAVNEREWDKLPADIKAMLPAACRQWSWDVIQRLALEDLKIVAEAKARNIHPVAWSAEDKMRIRAEALKVWADWKKKNEDCRKAIDSMEAFLKRIGSV
jgi:TRAP-type mannitol/chloroaromatic compound transport system substrate-binding protein